MYKLQNGKIKKVYIDSRYKTSDSKSNTDFKFEIKEAFGLQNNTVMSMVFQFLIVGLH